MTILAYKAYILLVVGVLLQLDSLPAAWDSAEAAAFRSLLPGPGAWCAPSDLRNLRAFGFPQKFPDVALLSSRPGFAQSSALASFATGWEIISMG